VPLLSSWPKEATWSGVPRTHGWRRFRGIAMYEAKRSRKGEVALI